MTAIEGRALRNEDNGPVPWSSRHNTVVERTPGKIASRESSTKGFIEAVRLDVFTPPGSPFDRHRVVVFPLNVNKPGYIGVHPIAVPIDLFGSASRVTAAAACLPLEVLDDLVAQDIERDVFVGGDAF